MQDAAGLFQCMIEMGNDLSYHYHCELFRAFNNSTGNVDTEKHEFVIKEENSDI